MKQKKSFVYSFSIALYEIKTMIFSYFLKIALNCKISEIEKVTNEKYVYFTFYSVFLYFLIKGGVSGAGVDPPS